MTQYATTLDEVLALRSESAQLRALLSRHHRYHLTREAEQAVEYGESALYEETYNVLHSNGQTSGDQK